MKNLIILATVLVMFASCERKSGRIPNEMSKPEKVVIVTSNPVGGMYYCKVKRLENDNVLGYTYLKDSYAIGDTTLAYITKR